MFNFDDLTQADCPLLASDATAVVDRFNEAGLLFREIEQKYPALLAREDVKNRARKLDEIRARLMRQRYLVGFLGTTTAGKSTAFNNILDASEADVPSQCGIGGATTSAITRVRRKDTGRHSLSLRYLTLEEYKAKRNKLCEVVGLNPPRADEEILAELPKYRQDVKNGAHATAGDDGEILPEDLNALDNFLMSYKNFKDYVRETTYERTDAEYAERSKFLNHAVVSGGKIKPSPNFLLRDALIEFRTDKIPHQLEIIDLPGLGSQGSIDSLLTKGFLKQLDGALVFVRLSTINDENVERVLARFKQYFDDRLTSRVWVVFTWVDGLSKHHFFGNESGQSIFDIVLRFLDGHKIPTEQVCLTSDRIYKARGPDGLTKLDHAVAHLQGLTVAEPIPPKFKEHPQLNQAFAELLKDGGVGRLRELLAKVLAKEVSNETRIQAEKELGSLIEALRDDRDMEARRQAAKPTELLDAFNCCDRITLLLNQWEARIDVFEPLTQQMKTELLAQIDKGIPGNDEILSKIPVPQLAARFEVVAKSLQATMDNLMDTEIIEKVFGEVGSQIGDLPAVHLWSDAGPPQAWERFAREDRRSHDWRTGFPSFSCKRLFAEMPGLDDKREYRVLMREKVRTGSHQAMHALKARVRGRLQELLKELGKLAYDVNGSTPNA